MALVSLILGCGNNNDDDDSPGKSLKVGQCITI